MNIKSQKFQEQIDLANTSMKNMKLSEELQNKIREFMISTWSSLENQKELDKFYTFISPSLRLQVTQFIFTNSIEQNVIFKDNLELIDFLIYDVHTELHRPEDTVITQGHPSNNFYFIANGECEVWVKDHHKQSVYVKQLVQGEYFGEIGLLT
jgi:hypothetical protein